MLPTTARFADTTTTTITNNTNTNTTTTTTATTTTTTGGVLHLKRGMTVYLRAEELSFSKSLFWSLVGWRSTDNGAVGGSGSSALNGASTYNFNGIDGARSTGSGGERHDGASASGGGIGGGINGGIGGERYGSGFESPTDEFHLNDIRDSPPRVHPHTHGYGHGRGGGGFSMERGGGGSGGASGGTPLLGEWDWGVVVDVPGINMGGEGRRFLLRSGL